jgi:RimJ/RimL family protein N-acetyltransferase
MKAEKVPLPVRLKTNQSGLTLRRFEKKDAPALFKLIDRNRDHLSRFGEPTSQKYPDSESVYRSIVYPDNLERFRYGIWKGKRLVGTVNLTRKKHGVAEVGYWVGKEFAGKGYARIATQTLVNYALMATDISEVRAHIHISNMASVATILHAGFAFNFRLTKAASEPHYAWYSRSSP